jgi:DNA repair protein RadC
MARTDRTHHVAAFSDDSSPIESLAATIRTLWTAVERANDQEAAILKQDITETINRLKGRIEKRIGKPQPTSREPLLFDVPDEQPPDPKVVVPPLLPRFTEPTLRVYAKDLADHALEHLPESARFHRVEDFRHHLARSLRFNSQTTRRRNSDYIVNRFFPNDVFNDDLPQFAAATAGKPALGEALFYLTCRTEKIVSMVAEEVVFPSIAQGGVSRSRIHEYIQSKFPHSKSAGQMSRSVLHTYQVYGIGNTNRTHLKVSLREGSLASFAYVLYLEFPEPGMYAFEKMLDGPMHKWLLWDGQWMVRQLYRLREDGLLSKVSEIDRLRQFTTKYTLADSMPHIVELAKESSR